MTGFTHFLEQFGLAAIAVSILIGVGATSLYQFWSKLIKISSEMEGIRTDLEKIIGDGSVDLEKLNQVSLRFGKSKVFNHPWIAFEATLIKDQGVEEVQIYNTQPFSTFVPFQELIDKQLNAQSFMKAPGLITSMGLAFTFTFIVIGLSHLKPLPSGKIEGISELIEGLSAKFISSITSLLVSILLTIAEDNLTRRLEETYNQLAELMDRKFQKQPPEYYLRSLEWNIREMNKTMKSLNMDLVEAIKAGNQEGMTEALKKLMETMSKFESQNAQNIGEVISEALSKIFDKFDPGGANQFKEFGITLEKLNALMADVAKSSNESTEKMEELLTVLGSQTQLIGQETNNAISKMEEGVLPVMEEVESHTKLQAEILEKMLNIIVQFWKSNEPYRALPKKRLGEHLKELRQNDF